jgi:tRNA A37 methylthiotransferase MiaB
MKNINPKDNRKVAIATLGCKVNQYETTSFLVLLPKLLNNSIHHLQEAIKK